MNSRPGRRGKQSGLFGNVLRHAYDQVDPDRIWEIATRDVPLVMAAAKEALQRLETMPPREGP
jgi:uncharacterized protein with HEPN domain